MKPIMDAEQVETALDRLYLSVVAALPRKTRIAVVGIRTRGETIANRLVERLRRDKKRKIERGGRGDREQRLSVDRVDRPASVRIHTGVGDDDDLPAALDAVVPDRGRLGA